MQNMTSSRNVSVTSIGRIRLLAIMLFLIATASTGTAAPWDRDLGFGTGGRVLFSPNNNTVSAWGTGIAVQSDGKIVMSGHTDPHSAAGFIVARFNVDGTLDTTFASPLGYTTVSFGAGINIARAVAIQPDGKIVVGGTDLQDATIARLNSDGTLDTSFDGDGKAIVNFPDGPGNISFFLNALELAPDGKIVIAGQGGPGPNFQYKTIAARLLSNGTLDSSFDGDGRVIDALGSGAWNDIVINSDGSVVLVANASTQSSSHVRVRKLNADGSEAWLYTKSQNIPCYTNLYGVAAQADGKFVAVGSRDCKPVIYRVNADGSEDATFSNTTLNFDGQFYAVTVQPDGKILAGLGGYALAQFHSNGTLNPAWGTNGVSNTGFNGQMADILIQSDGKILMGGLSSGRMGLVRFLGSTSPVVTRTQFDYDGDGSADVSVFRPSTGEWFVFNSGNSTVTVRVFGVPGDAPVPADFDGDGKTDIAIRRPFNQPAGGWWYLLSGGDGSPQNFPYVPGGDYARPGDFTGDGKADIITYNSTNGVWARKNFVDGVSSDVTFGAAGDKPVLGDFDGDDKVDPAIYRPSTGEWWYSASSAGGQHRAGRWGISTDIPAPGDYDGDNKTDFAVYRPSTGVWYIFNSSNGSFTIMSFGLAEDRPVPADYDADGRADIAVFRPSTGVWYIQRSTGGFIAFQWGVSTDISTESVFIP